MLKAFVVGGTGAVGSELVKLLASDPRFGQEEVIVDFDHLNGSAFEGMDIGFCSLGTTRKKSGVDGFIKVDHDYVVNTARLAKENGVKQFILISSAGANEKSYFLYTKTKGQVEREISELGFEKYVIIRPGLIEADREESRLGESLFKQLVKPLKLLTNSLASSATDIARTMIKASLSPELPSKTYWNNARVLEFAPQYQEEVDELNLKSLSG